MVAVAVTGQQEPLGGQRGPVAPQCILEEGCARLRLADMQVNARAPGEGDPIILGGRHPARIYRDLKLTSDSVCSTPRAPIQRAKVGQG